MEIKPVILNGEEVKLIPLSIKHIPELTCEAKDKDIWQYLPYGVVTTEEKISNMIQFWLDRAERGIDLPFTVIYRSTELPIGNTRLLDINHQHKSVEIGGTWYGKKYQRTKVNTECKYLLLRFAFESLGCIRVQFKTDSLNIRSQNALERIGAVKEGILRNHMIRTDGSFRDSVYYSIVIDEWAGVKEKLEEKLSN